MCGKVSVAGPTHAVLISQSAVVEDITIGGLSVLLSYGWFRLGQCVWDDGYRLSLGGCVVTPVENNRCGGNDPWCGCYVAGWDSSSEDTKFVVSEDEDHDRLC